MPEQTTAKQNIDMFMACCDWEAAANDDQNQSDQDDLNDPLDPSINKLVRENNGTESDKIK